MNPRRLFALIRKEFFQIVRDPSTLLIAIALPLLYLFLYGYGVSLDTSKARIGLAMESTAPEAWSLARAFMHSRYFTVQLGHDRREFEKELVAGDVRGIVVIPQDFSEKLLNNEEVAPIQIIADGSEPNTANFVQNYARGAWEAWKQQRALNSPDGTGDNPPIQLTTRFWYNPELESRNYLLPGSLAIILTTTATLLTALVIAREWERGTMEALITTPVTRLELLISKLFPYFCLGMGTLLMCFLITLFWFHLPFRGDLIVMLGISAVFLCTTLSFGLMISATAKNQFAASQLAMFGAFLPAFLLSGFLFEIHSMPWLIQQITRFVPARYYIQSIQGLYLVGNVWTILWHATLAMGAIALFYLLMAYRQISKRLEG